MTSVRAPVVMGPKLAGLVLDHLVHREQERVHGLFAPVIDVAEMPFIT
ncbi:MAG: hypothetical protein K2Q09_00175 [Phycisphaerales bacterium]|nr:hypothetical protein [Phycisphaerales bacterium]